MGSFVGHLYPRLVRLALRVKEQEKQKRNVVYASCRGPVGVNRGFTGAVQMSPFPRTLVSQAS